MSEQKLDDGFVNVAIFVGMLFDKARQHPKVVLIFALLAYASVCVALMKFSDINKPFLSISAFIAVFLAVPLIVLYKRPVVRQRRLDILSTEPSWFDEVESN